MLLTGCLVHFRVQTLGEIWFAGRLVAADMIDRLQAQTVCLCLVLWTSTCMCLNALFNRGSTHILRAFYFADIGITTDTTSNISSTCVVLALVAGRRDCQPCPNSQ